MANCNEKYNVVDGLCDIIKSSTEQCVSEGGNADSCEAKSNMAGNMLLAIKDTAVSTAKKIVNGSSVSDISITSGAECADRYSGFESADLNSFCKAYNDSVSECTTSLGSGFADWCKNTGRLVADYTVSVFNGIKTAAAGWSADGENKAVAAESGNGGIWKICAAVIVVGTVAGVGFMIKKHRENKLRKQAETENKTMVIADKQTESLENLQYEVQGEKQAKTLKPSAETAVKAERVI